MGWHLIVSIKQVFFLFIDIQSTGLRVIPSDSCEHGIVQLYHQGQWMEACGGDDWKFPSEILHHELEISPGMSKLYRSIL